MRVTADTRQLEVDPGSRAVVGVDVVNTGAVIDGISTRVIGLPEQYITAQPALLPTKFGPVETADMALLGAGGEHHCSAWRIVADEQDLRVTGWLCGPQGKPVERTTLACLVDRLQLSPAQTDAGLRAFFRDADRRRTPGCPAPKPVPAGRRPA